MSTTTDATTTPADHAAAMEQALLAENVGNAIVLENAHLSASEDIASAAQKDLRYDPTGMTFVRRDSGEKVGVRDWLKARREDRPHWFKTSDAKPTNAPKVLSKSAGFDLNQAQPTPPGTPAKQTGAPVGRVTQQMTEHEYAGYKKQNRHARILSSSNIGNRRVLTVDCGSQATPGQVGGQSLDEYRKWREAQGLGRGVGAY